MTHPCKSWISCIFSTCKLLCSLLNYFLFFFFCFGKWIATPLAVRLVANSFNQPYWANTVLHNLYRKTFGAMPKNSFLLWLLVALINTNFLFFFFWNLRREKNFATFSGGIIKLIFYRPWSNFKRKLYKQFTKLWTKKNWYTDRSM